MAEYITISGFESMTEQEVFDRCAAHLLEQGKTSSTRDGTCAYRGEEGRKCAAGIFIADEKYREDLEGNGWETLVRRGEAPWKHWEIIRDLQFLHDRIRSEDWRQALEKLAAPYGIEFKY